MEAGVGTVEAEALEGAETGVGLDGDIADADGEPLPDEVAAELAATEQAEHELSDDRASRLEEALTASARELEAQRRLTRSAVDRYREAALAAEPELPPELVRGETLEEIEGSLGEARAAVAQIRERLGATPASGSVAGTAGGGRGFPVGAPARGGVETGAMSTAEKIAYGLEQRAAAG